MEFVSIFIACGTRRWKSYSICLLCKREKSDTWTPELDIYFIAWMRSLRLESCNERVLCWRFMNKKISRTNFVLWSLFQFLLTSGTRLWKSYFWNYTTGSSPYFLILMKIIFRIYKFALYSIYLRKKFPVFFCKRDKNLTNERQN